MSNEKKSRLAYLTAHDKSTAISGNKRKIWLFSVILFTVLLITAMAVLFFVKYNARSAELKNKLSLAAEEVRLQVGISAAKEIALAKMAANTPAIVRYFSNPDDESLKADALPLFAAYQRNFASDSIFWVNARDKIFYLNGNKIYTVNPDLPENYWYNHTLYRTEVFNFNINYNPDLNDTKLWLNVPVFWFLPDGSRQVTGMLGSSVPINYHSVLISALPEAVNDMVFYLFNATGEITGSENFSQAANHTKIFTPQIFSKNGEIGKVIWQKAQSLRGLQTSTFTRNNQVFVIGAIPEIQWFLVCGASIGIREIIFEPMTIGILAAVFLILAVIVYSFMVFALQINKSLEIENSTLLEVSHKAEIASRAKGDFLARMSHEIRTPMNAILGMSELAYRENGSLNALKYITNIRQASNNLLGIINDILDFSKIESGNFTLATSPYETAILLNDIIMLVRARLTKTQINFIVNIPTNLPRTLIGDIVRVRQILLNLLTNAMKYTRHGYIKFTVQCESEQDSSGSAKLVFAVEDSGMGIKADDLSKLFSNFTRLDERKNSNIEGTGLGLVISRELCRTMNGDIMVRSQYGIGSTFTATIEQNVANWSPMGEFSQALQVAKEANDSLEITFIAPTVKVLLVDDNRTNLEVAMGLLQLYSLQVVTCLRGADALKLLSKQEFDLVFMDHMMPEMDGIQATKRIRALGGKFKKLPVIALTANVIFGMQEMFLENGCSDYLPKPIEMLKLDEILHKWIPSDKWEAVPQEKSTVTTAPSAQISADKKTSVITNPEISETESFPEIVGVNAQVGLANVRNSQERYRKILTMFCTDVAEAKEQLSHSPRTETLTDLAILTHALKSAAANIGATEISAAAFALEKAGKSNDLDFVANNLPAFRDNLFALIKNIETVLAQEPPAAENP